MNNLLVLFIFLTETIAAQNVSVTISKKGKSAVIPNEGSSCDSCLTEPKSIYLYQIFFS